MLVKFTFNTLIPELSVTDIEKSKHFYVSILGFKIEYERIEDKFAFISYGESQMMIEQINGYWETGILDYPFGRGINLQIKTSSLDLLHEKLILNGVTLFRDIDEFSYRQDDVLHNGREFLVQDPDGYLLRFLQFL